MLKAVGQLMARAVDKQPSGENCHVPPWAVAPIFILLALFFVFMILFQYAFFEVFVTLTIIEQPTYSSIRLNDDSQASLISADPQNGANPELIVANKPITSSLRQIYKHLRDIGGKLALFRGFGLWISYHFISVLISSAIAPMLSSLQINFLPGLGNIIVNLILARWLMAWTWIVISEPSPHNWWRRIPPSNTWRKIIPATFVFTVAQQISMAGPVLMISALGMPGLFEDVKQSPTLHQVPQLAGQSIAIVILSILIAVFFVIPAKIILARVHSSMLPDETEAIVPFDRSYNGKVIPVIVGGNGCLGIMDAIQSFPFSSWTRLAKIYLKTIALQLCILILFGTVMTIAILGIAHGAKRVCS